MVFDLKKHEANKLKFLEVLYDIVEYKRSNPPSPITDFMDIPKPITDMNVYTDIIVERSGFTSQEGERIISDLVHERKISASDLNITIHLTQQGVQEVETHRYESSFLAKRRRAGAWMIESTKNLAKSAWGWILGLIGAYVSGILTADKVKSILRSIMELLH
jgi:hypothetical protein